MSNRKPSMRYVATLVGVSHQTVSRVINGHPDVKKETRERALEGIESVDYRPDNAAKALAQRRSNRTTLLVDSAAEEAATHRAASSIPPLTARVDLRREPRSRCRLRGCRTPGSGLFTRH